MSKKRNKSNPSKQETPAPAGSPKSSGLLPARACLAVSASVSAYLLWYAITKKPMAGCGPGSPCDKVMGSSWAYWLGLPVSAPALAAYLSLLACSFGVGSKRPKSASFAWSSAFFLGAMVVGSALWFTGVQLFILKTVCKFCSTAHFFSVVGIVLFLREAPFLRFAQNRSGPSKVLIPRPPLARLALGGLLAVAALVAGQQLAPRKTNIVAIHKGGFTFNPVEMPLIGSPDTGHFLVSLFDYTCPDCHDMHHQLLAARERLGNQFTVISLPLPLDGKCNPMIRETRPHHAQACEYAKIGLAVRKVGQEAFAKYDQWFFGQRGLAKLDAARQKAVELGVQTNLDAALADPWVDKMIQTSVSIYATNGLATRSYRMPQLVLGDAINIGPVRALDDLVKLISVNLQLTNKP